MQSFGEFLYLLRKEKGMTQTALAERLGVTNKAVSKWETGEAMPETSLLVPLSEIFGVTVDELLNGKRNEQDPAPTIQEPPAPAQEHIFPQEENMPQTNLHKIRDAVCAVLVLSGVAAYLFIGALYGWWHPYWLIIPVCALGSGIVGTLFDLCDTRKRNYKIAQGKNPYTDGICGIIMLASVIAYLLCGGLCAWWHPHWIIVVGGAIVCGLVGAVGKAVPVKNKDK